MICISLSGRNLSEITISAVSELVTSDVEAKKIFVKRRRICSGN
jgi:hypothetical protein